MKDHRITGALLGLLLAAILVWASGWEPERGGTAVFVLIEAVGVALLGAVAGSIFKRGRA